MTARRPGRFGQALGRGRRLTGKLLQLVVDADGERAVVVVVGKKILPAAVRRNRARRVLRELFRHEGASLVDGTVIFRLRQAPRDSRMRDLVAEGRSLLRRAAGETVKAGRGEP